MQIIDKFRFWDAKHQRWFQGHPDSYHRSLQTDCIHLFGEIMIMGAAFSDQNEDDIWRNDKDVHSSLEMLNYIQVIHCAQLQDKNEDWIFEGDVVDFDDRKMLIYWNSKFLSWFAIDLKTGYSYRLFDLQPNNLISIEGNVYDNPEYMKTISEESLKENNVFLPHRKLDKIDFRI